MRKIFLEKPYHTLLVKHSSPESSTNKARFKKFCKHLAINLSVRYLFVVFKKNGCVRSDLPDLSFQIFWQKQRLTSKFAYTHFSANKIVTPPMLLSFPTQNNQYLESFPSPTARKKKCDGK